MNAPQYRGESEHTPGENTIIPNVWIDVWSDDDIIASKDRRYTAAIGGLQALKCSAVRGYGSTEEEAVLNLRRKVLQFLDFQPT